MSEHKYFVIWDQCYNLIELKVRINTVRKFKFQKGCIEENLPFKVLKGTATKFVLDQVENGKPINQLDSEQ